MEARPYGRSGIVCPVVGLGTWKVFNVTSPEDKSRCRKVVDAAFAKGARLFDSSPMYGHAEHVLAETLMGRREQAIVATKVWASTLEEARKQIRDGLTYYEGRVDLYQVHNLSLTSQVLGLFDELKSRGAIRAVGATHYQPSAFGELMTWMESGRLAGIQIPYSIGERTAERDVLPLAERLGLGVLAMLPFQQGRLLGRAPPARSLRAFEEFGCTSWPQVLLKWILSDRRVTAAIPATQDAHHMTENAAAGSPPWFDEETRAAVLKIAGESRR